MLKKQMSDVLLLEKAFEDPDSLFVDQAPAAAQFEGRTEPP